MKKAIIFDLDGTLINSIPYHLEIHKAVFKDLNITVSNEFFHTRCNGSSPKDFYKIILEHYAGNLDLYDKAMVLCEEKDALKIQELKQVKLFPQVRDVLERLKKQGLLLAVASSSPIKYIETFLEHTGIKDFFCCYTGGDEVKHSKPAPDIFLRAQEKLGIAKEDCVIIEDAVQGVLAAQNAGIECICLLTTEKEEDIPEYATIAQSHDKIIKLIKNM
ncbi:MAG: HAD family hydrolase [Candidatus Woesearchaeota archaeon]